jgi:hypothetical protein
MRGLSRKCAVVCIAAAVLAILAPRTAIERFYSDGVYLLVQPLATSLTNHAPFAILDLLIVFGSVGWLAAFGIDVVQRAAALTVTIRLVVRSLVWGGILYFGFLAMWGLNYRREPLEEKLTFAVGNVSSKTARQLFERNIDELNRLSEPAHLQGWPPEPDLQGTLAKAFARTQRDFGAPRLAQPGNPKRTLLDWYLRRTGVAGMTDPFFLETLIARDLLPFERSFVIAHEWAHLAGYADEGEANFVGWLTCLRSEPPEQYSAWLFLYDELASGMPPRDRRELSSRLADGPRSDLRAIAERLRRQVNPTMAIAGWRVYDRYLKLNSVEEGAASYSRVVRYVLGTEFGEQWTPRLRSR